MKLLISLDTELAWGITSEAKLRRLARDGSAGREPVRFLLDTFDTYEIPATWAVVGHLLLKECSQESHDSTSRIAKVDPFSNRSDDPLYYAPEIVDWIRTSQVDHEIAGHSFTHPHFSGLTRQQAREELESMVAVFRSREVNLRSIVHPFMDIAHIELLPEFGISAYSLGGEERGKTLKAGIRPFLSRDEDFWSVPTVTPSVDERGLLSIPRSRQLRDERWGWLNARRVKNALAMHSDGVIHLNFHPHNLLYDPFLRKTVPKIARIIADARDEGRVEVVTFSQLADQLR